MEDAQRRLLIHRLPTAGIILPLLLAVAFHAVGPRPRPIAAAPSCPALAFDQYLVDLGKVAPSEEVRAHFDFTNRGRATITNIQLDPSCGCLQPQLNKQAFEPGESGNFVVRVQTANQSAGPKEYTIAIRYKDPKPRETIVAFRVDLPENQVFVRPKVLILYQPGDESVPPQHIEITDRRGKSRHLNITSAECTRHFVETEIEESEVDQNGHWHGHLKVTVPGKLPPGSTDAMIRIVTDDPEYQKLRVPLRLEGQSPRRIIDSHLQTVGGTESPGRQ
jgi:hypothetical protein